jgi:CheY-like chemotaxis protein
MNEVTTMNLDSDQASSLDGRSRHEIVSNFEHDLRNICSAMQSAVDVIRLDKGLSKDSLEMLAILDRQLLHLTKTVTGLSDQTGDRSSSTATIEPKPSAPAEYPALSRKLDVLVVDDTRLVSYTLQKILEKLGHSVRTASSGVSAIASIREKVPDIVFSDIGMAEMDGYELAKQIRAMPKGSDIWLVALTGCGTPDSERKSIEAGFDEHFVKPISYETIVNVLIRASANS